jgi:protocatechuate 3,4-dioxygenase beta subunit
VFGGAFTQRLVTQMYFPDDPLFFQDPIFNSVPDERARARLVAGYDHEATTDHWALGFRWDIVLRGAGQTPFEGEPDDE